MNRYSLPASLRVGGADFSIRTDFRVILKICQYFANPDYEEEAWAICLRSLYVDFDKIPREALLEAAQQALWFIDGGITNQKDEGVKKPILMDWEQDASLIIPAINKVAGMEVRAVQYMHWWTFLGYYQEIGDSVFSTVLSIRSKMAKGKKLEKWEKEYLRDNRKMVTIQRKMSKEEQLRDEEEKRLLDELL